MSDFVDGESLRKTMRHVPSPVTVITAAFEGEIRGVTIGSFASTSLDPPLISFNLARDAQIFPMLLHADHFIVHVLSDEQAHLANHFALPDVPAERQFDGVTYSLDQRGVPVLPGALVVVNCERRGIFDAGDHVIIVGQVLGVTDLAPGRPLVYYDRGYHEIGAAADVTLFDPFKTSNPAK